ncbi:MAG: hypothetical protein ACI8XZ_002436 [Gammaproteobacteria bacterium]|jgi:hypothetical protein
MPQLHLSYTTPWQATASCEFRGPQLALYFALRSHKDIVGVRLRRSHADARYG